MGVCRAIRRAPTCHTLGNIRPSTGVPEYWVVCLDACVVERERKRTGENRSAVFERALTAYLADRRRVNAERSYVDGYRHAPESAADVRVATATAMYAFASEPWDA
jgi:hypothetical protein